MDTEFGDSLKDSTLCFLIRENPAPEVLLGFKKVRFGAGKYAGFGGGVEPGETIIGAAVREMKEETSVTVFEDKLQRVGHLTFLFPDKPAWSQVVHVFSTREWEGEPVESEEMRPEWFRQEEIPYEQMWQDAAHWLPKILARERIRATYIFNVDNESVDDVRLAVWKD